MDKVRLQKFLAEAGVASRRKAEELIRDGRVSVNGVVITDMGIRVSGTDIIELDGKPVSAVDKKIYIMLNKPVGYVTTARDQFGRPAVVDLIKDINARIYPVGRLDYDTSGLLILTNDGEFTYRLTHPKHEIEKIYVAEVSGIPDKADIERFRKGIEIEDYMTAPAGFEILKSKKNELAATVKITIHEGKNRQVRKMCSAIGHPVKSLKRIAVGKVELGALAEGKWRYLSGEELCWLGL